MYLEWHKIERVEEFKVDTNFLVFKGTGSGRKHRILFAFKNGEITSLAEGISGFQLEKNHIYYSNWNNESFKFDLDSRILSKLDYEQISIYKLNDFIFFNKENKYHIMSKEVSVISKSVLGHKNILDDSIIYSTDALSNKINSYDISCPEKMNWEMSLSQFGTYKNHWQQEKQVEVSSFVGVWQEQLLVLLNNGVFIGIDVETGELLWEKRNVDHNNTGQEVDYAFGSPYNPFLDEEKGIVYILQGDTFIKFDLKRRQATYRWHSKDDSFENYLFIKQSRLKDNLIYFTASVYPDLGADNTIGVFDIERNKVIWEYTLPFESGVFIPNSQDKIQLNDKNLFVLDSGGVLHIFEKQDQLA